MTVPEANDEIAIVDASAATTKKITRADFLKGAALPADTVDTQAIADGAVTTAKINLDVTTDLNWEIIDHGNYITYTRVNATNIGSQATLFDAGEMALPAGLAMAVVRESPINLTVAVIGGGSNPSRFIYALDLSGSTIVIKGNNTWTSSLSPGNIRITVSILVMKA